MGTIVFILCCTVRVSFASDDETTLFNQFYDDAFIAIVFSFPALGCSL